MERYAIIALTGLWLIQPALADDSNIGGLKQNAISCATEVPKPQVTIDPYLCKLAKHYRDTVIKKLPDKERNAYIDSYPCN